MNRHVGNLVSFLLVAFLATAFMAVASPAQQPADGMDDIDVEVVNVEVYVTDDDGHTVEGLAKADFRLFVDHAPTVISNFYRAEGLAAGTPLSEGTVAPSVQRPESAATGATGVPIGAAASRTIPTSFQAQPQPADTLTLVIYVDHLQLKPSGRRSYLRQIRDFLDGRLQDGDNLLVVSHNLGIQVEKRFSGDFDEISKALESMWHSPAGALEYGRQYQHALDQIETILVSTTQESGVGSDSAEQAAGTPGVADDVLAGLENFTDPCARVDRMLNVARSYGEWVASQVDRSLDNLERLVKALGGIDGRKSVLYLSNGLDQTPGLDMQYQVADLCPTRSFQTVGTELSTRLIDATYRLASLANSQHVTFYNLDASRLEGSASSGIERAPSVKVNGRTFDLRPSPTVDARRREARQATLTTLAQETGGLVILNANEIDVDLERIDDSMRRFYSLGFSPDTNAPGATHLLRVELAPPRSGYQLHYRRTYQEEEPQDRTTGHLLSALLLGHEQNPLGVDIQVGLTRISDAGTPVVPLRIAVPFGALGWLEHGDYRDARVELMVAVQDAESREIDMRNKSIPFRIKESLWAEAQGRAHTIEIALPVPSADARLAFALADRVGGRTSFLSPASTPSG